MTSMSANAYASGNNQNCGNVMTGRSTTRLLAPPGGQSSFSIGWSDPKLNSQSNDMRRMKGKSQSFGIASTGSGGVGMGAARLFSSQQQNTGAQNKSKQQSSFQIGYQTDTHGQRSLAGNGQAILNSNSRMGSIGASAGLSSSNPYYTQRSSGRMGMVMGAGRSDGLMLPTSNKVTNNADKHVSYSTQNYGGVPSQQHSVSNYSPRERSHPYPHMPSSLSGSSSSALQQQQHQQQQQQQQYQAPPPQQEYQNVPNYNPPRLYQNTGAQNKTKQQSSLNLGYQQQESYQTQQQHQQSQPFQQSQPQNKSQQELEYQQRYQQQQQSAVLSSNEYSSGASQNNGNVMTGRSTTRRLAPPGGFTSFSLG